MIDHFTGPWIDLAGGGAVRVAVHEDGIVELEFAGPPRRPKLLPDDGRRLALELTAAAERIDPMPPPRPDAGPRRRGRPGGRGEAAPGRRYPGGGLAARRGRVPARRGTNR